MNGYNLSRHWFNWAFENPDINTPAHTALFMWIIEKWNRLGQKEKFGLPTSEAMEVLGVSSVRTYKKVFNNLIEWGFIAQIEESKNQHTSTIIALSKFDKAPDIAPDIAPDKALDKALTKQMPKQSQSTIQSIATIDKQLNQEINKPLNQEVRGGVETEVPTTDMGEGADEKITTLPSTAEKEKEVDEKMMTLLSTAEKEKEVDEKMMTLPSTAEKEKAGGAGAAAENIHFQAVWDSYDKKIGDRQRCEKKWCMLSDKEKWLVWQHIPKYVRSTPDKKYRANLETYLNQKRWNNEIIQIYAKSGNKTTTTTTAAAKQFLEKPRAIGGDPIRRNIFGKEEKPR